MNFDHNTKSLTARAKTWALSCCRLHSRHSSHDRGIPAHIQGASLLDIALLNRFPFNFCYYNECFCCSPLFTRMRWTAWPLHKTQRMPVSKSNTTPCTRPVSHVDPSFKSPDGNVESNRSGKFEVGVSERECRSYSAYRSEFIKTMNPIIFKKFVRVRLLLVGPVGRRDDGRRPSSERMLRLGSCPDTSGRSCVQYSVCGLGRRPAGNLSLTCILANGQRGKRLCGRVASPPELPALPGLRSKLQLNELLDTIPTHSL